MSLNKNRQALRSFYSSPVTEARLFLFLLYVFNTHITVSLYESNSPSYIE